MRHLCPSPDCQSLNTIASGSFFRKCDSRHVKRFRCRRCGKSFSLATGTLEFRQHNRRANHAVKALLAAAVSMRETGRVLGINIKTVARKLVYLAKKCEIDSQRLLSEHGPVSRVQFDELETFETTRCKPVSIAIAVESGTRLILGFRVSRMPAKGRLAKVSVPRYGRREDGRRDGLVDLFRGIAPHLDRRVDFLSDRCPLYRGALQRALREKPVEVSHRQVKGRRGSDTGGEEIRKGGWDPLFWLNHTCAMLRQHVSRLLRHTWNTTKKLECLVMHLHVYMNVHNRRILRLKE